MSGPSADWLDGPMDSAEFLRHNGHAYRDPKHPMHENVTREFNRMVRVELGSTAGSTLGPGGEVMTPPVPESLLRKP